MKIAIVFKQAHYGSSDSREGLDTLLSLASFSDDISCFFIGDGVLNLKKNQQAGLILQREHTATFKLLELYEIEERYVSSDALSRLGITIEDCLIACTLDRELELLKKIKQCDKVLTF